jgi:hypothetical protein
MVHLDPKCQIPPLRRVARPGIEFVPLVYKGIPYRTFRPNIKFIGVEIDGPKRTTKGPLLSQRAAAR